LQAVYFAALVAMVIIVLCVLWYTLRVLKSIVVFSLWIISRGLLNAFNYVEIWRNSEVLKDVKYFNISNLPVKADKDGTYLEYVVSNKVRRIRLPPVLAQSVPITPLASQVGQEMAMPNSKFTPNEASPSKTTTRGLFAIRLAADHNVVVGMAFRVGLGDVDVIMTALHNLKLSHGQPLVLEHRGNCFAFSESTHEQVLLSHEYDCIAFKPKSSAWYSVAGAARLSPDPGSSGPAIVWGYQDGFFGQSRGSFRRKQDDAMFLTHTASTIAGFSGSPILTLNGRVVGFHTHAEQSPTFNGNAGTSLLWAMPLWRDQEAYVFDAAAYKNLSREEWEAATGKFSEKVKTRQVKSLHYTHSINTYGKYMYIEKSERSSVSNSHWDYMDEMDEFLNRESAMREDSSPPAATPSFEENSQSEIILNGMITDIRNTMITQRETLTEKQLRNMHKSILALNVLLNVDFSEEFEEVPITPQVSNGKEPQVSEKEITSEVSDGNPLTPVGNPITPNWDGKEITALVEKTVEGLLKNFNRPQKAKASERAAPITPVKVERPKLSTTKSAPTVLQTKNSKKKAALVESGVKKVDFQKRPSSTPKTGIKLSPVMSGKTVKPSVTGGLDYEKLADVLLSMAGRRLRSPPNACSEQEKPKKVLQSGISPLVTQELNSGLYSFKPVSSVVLSPAQEAAGQKIVDICVVSLSRKQDKAYNRICQTRTFQRLLRDSGPENARTLRRSLLTYVLSLGTTLTVVQVQDFLSAYLQETMAPSSTTSLTLSSRRC